MRGLKQYEVTVKTEHAPFKMNESTQWYNLCILVQFLSYCYNKKKHMNSGLLFFLLSNRLAHFHRRRTGGICPYKSQQSKQG